MSDAGHRREELKAVWEQASTCQKCPQLASTRQTVVFGSGNADADLMFVGEAPGANEDKQGVPFVGQAGKLLEQLLNEIGLERSDVFIANVLKCRPPGNRDPLPQEIDNCQDYLFRQLAARRSVRCPGGPRRRRRSSPVLARDTGWGVGGTVVFKVRPVVVTASRPMIPRSVRNPCSAGAAAGATLVACRPRTNAARS